MQASLAQSPADGLNDLQARVMAQWTQRTATADPVVGGASGILQLSLHSVRIQVVLLATRK